MRMLSTVLLFFMVAIPATAQDYPDYQELYVNDFANALTDGEANEIRTKLIELRDKRDIEFTVVTISSFWDYGYDGRIEPFATGLFNYWGVGDAGRNDGVMMLVSIDDRVMRLELGAGYSRDKDAQMKDIIDSVILPLFRDGDYASGISDGVDEVILNITGSWPGEYDASAPEKALGFVRRTIDSLGSWLYAILAPFLYLPYQIYRRWRRNRPRICPNDNARMRRLDEKWDDTHLNPGQITEERLKSVDYDVWVCDRCDHVRVEGYRAWFTRYSPCRSCNARTLEADSTTLVAATTSSTGKRRIDYHCHNCDDSWSVTRTIPVKSSSSSSSSGSFGGGSSSGGGASGSW